MTPVSVKAERKHICMSKSSRAGSMMLLKVTDAWLIERTVSMDFRTSTKQEAPYAIMKLEGELDFASKDHLVLCVEQFLAAGSKHIRLDVTALRFCDASGLSALVHAKRMCDE